MKNLIYLFILLPIILNAQVGIGTTNPNAKLDIRSSNQATPTNKDGLLIPKIDEYPATNPTTLQDGMLVFATGNGSITKGFYYWDNTATSWVLVNNGSSAEKIDDLLDGKSDNDGTDNGSSVFLGIDAGLNDDGSNNRNIGLGLNTLYNNSTGNRNIAIGFQTLFNNIIGEHNVANGYKTLVLNTNGNDNTATGYEALYSNTTGKSNVGFGFQVLRRNTDGDYNIGIGNKAGYFAKGDRNIFIGNEAGEGIANYNIDRSVFLGNQAGRHETSSDRLYIDNSQTTDPLIYGEFDNDLLRINGELQIGDPSTTGYKFPTTDGLANQVLETDGNGTITWQDNSFIGDNPKYPDGLRNIQPVTHNFNNGNYIVPVGKNLYITSIYSSAPGAPVYVNGLIVQRGVNNSFHTTQHYHSSINNPIIAKAGDVISGSYAINGFLVNAKVIPIIVLANNYNVPNNKILVILSIYSNPLTTFSVDGIPFFLGRGNFSNLINLSSMYNGLYAPVFADEGSVITSMNIQNTGVFGNIIGYLRDK